VARALDPDYCKNDMYYGLGVAITSAVIGFVGTNGTVTFPVYAIVQPIILVLKTVCPKRAQSWSTWLKYGDVGDLAYTGAAVAEYDGLCKLALLILNPVARATYNNRGGTIWAIDGENMYADESKNPAVATARQILWGLIDTLLLRPASLLDAGNEISFFVNNPNMVNPDSTEFWSDYDRQMAEKEIRDVSTSLTTVAVAAWIAFMVKNMQELARGIASYFRVNNRKRLKGEEMMLNPKVFRERIQEEIANGPGPAVPPPEVQQLTPEEVKAQEEARLKEQEDLQRLLDETPFVGGKM